MALTICNECGKQVATTAEACPNCGNPINPIKKETKTVVTPNPVTPVETETFPKWVIIPVVIIGALLLFFLFTVMSQKDENANANVNIDINKQIPATTVTDNNPPPTTDTTINTVDPNVPTSTTTNPPAPVNDQQVSPDTKTEVVKNETPDKGNVTLEAKVSDKSGKVQSVNDEKFYLLDKDLETILREAKLQNLPNQNLVNSFGLSVLNPGKYGEFNKKALDAINSHVKYDVLTNNAGKAEMSNVEPNSYYLFGIHKVGKGFAIWSSPVTVKKGENNLQIQPQRMTEIQE